VKQAQVLEYRQGGLLSWLVATGGWWWWWWWFGA